MASSDPVQEALARIATLRAAIAVERSALADLDLNRLETLADQRRALDLAWGDVLTTFRDVPDHDDPQLDWARRQMLADLDALRHTWLADRQRRVAYGAAFEALAAALDETAPAVPGTVVPLDPSR